MKKLLYFIVVCAAMAQSQVTRVSGGSGTVPAGGRGIGDPGSNGIVYRNGAGTSTSATATEIAGPIYCTDAGSNDTYACSLSPAPSAYTTGAKYIFKANTANTGAATINFNSLGAKTIVKVAGGITTALVDNDIRSGQIVELVYDGTNMQMQSTLGNAASGGASLSYGTYASLPATCTTGDRYLTSDSIYEFACTAANTWTAFAFGVPVTVPPQSSWTEVNKGVSDSITYNGIITIAGASTASVEDFVLVVRSTPATPYTAEFGVLGQFKAANFGASGACFRQSSDGKLIRVGFIYDTTNSGMFRFGITTMSSPTSGVANLFSESMSFPFLQWIRLEDDGTNRKYYISPDRFTWTLLYTESRTTYLTADQIGLELGKTATFGSIATLFHYRIL